MPEPDDVPEAGDATEPVLARAVTTRPVSQGSPPYEPTSPSWYCTAPSSRTAAGRATASAPRASGPGAPKRDCSRASATNGGDR